MKTVALRIAKTMGGLLDIVPAGKDPWWHDLADAGFVDGDAVSLIRSEDLDDLRARLTAAEERLLDAGEAVDASRATISDVRTALGGNATDCETKDIVELAEDVVGRLAAAEGDAGRMREALRKVPDLAHEIRTAEIHDDEQAEARADALLVECSLALSPPTGHAAGEVAACPSTCASFQMEGGYALQCDCPAPVDEKGKAP